MSYRDDLEAARARAASLEEENESLREREGELEAKAEQLAARERELESVEADAKARAKEARTAKKKAKELQRRVEEERVEREREDAQRAEEEEPPPPNDRVIQELEVARLDRDWDREERELIAQYFPRIRRGGRIPKKSDVGLMRLMGVVVVGVFGGGAVIIGMSESSVRHGASTIAYLMCGIAVVMAVAFLMGLRSMKAGIEAIERARSAYEARRADVLDGRRAKKRRKPRARIASVD